MDTPSAPLEWWYAFAGERRGPVNSHELRHLFAKGELGANSLIWKHGMEGWQPAQQVPALSPLLSLVPPELPANPVVGEANSSNGFDRRLATDWRSLFFSLRGRINRQPFWIGVLCLSLASWVGQFLVGMAGSLNLGAVAVAVFISLNLLIAFSWLSITVKRLHDMGWSGWWALLAYSTLAVIPAIVFFNGEAIAVVAVFSYLASIAFLLLIGTLKGTLGPNRYGDDPLAIGSVPGTQQLSANAARESSKESTVRARINSLIETAGGAAFLGLYVFGFAGWAYWMWLAIKFGSFLMFFVGLLGPLAFIAALLGMWSLVFGVPAWLVNLVA